MLQRRESDRPDYVLEQGLELLVELGVVSHQPAHRSLDRRGILKALHTSARDPSLGKPTRVLCRGEGCLLAGRDSAAMTHYRRVAESEVSPAALRGVAWDRLGDIAWWNGDFQDAVRCYERSLEFRPDNGRTRADLARAVFRAHGTDEKLRDVFDPRTVALVDRPSVSDGVTPSAGPGVVEVIGLYTQPGGAGLLPLQGRRDRLSDTFTITGNLGVSAREACELGWALWQEQCDESELRRVRVHVSQGGMAKDGPSIGLAAHALVGSVVGRLHPRQRDAFTGELDLRGKVCAVGGVPEKVLAAYLTGCDRVFLPSENLDEVQSQFGHLIDLRPCSSVADLEALVS